MQRAIDANLNRMNEGLRVLEDVSRFLLNDATLSAKLKSLRHQLAVDDLPTRASLLSSRDTTQDVGAFPHKEPGPCRRDLPGIVAANARRVEESLRVLEEFAKLPEAVLESARFKEARFALYDIERELTGKVLRRDKSIAGLYVIIDPEVAGDRNVAEVAEKAIRGGARLIQLRDKGRDKGEVLSRAHELKALCARRNVLFVVNDYLDVAIASDADGLHIGPEDLPVSTARRLLPIDRLLGRSARSIEVARQAEADGADYVAVGSMYATGSKADTVVVGIEMLRQIREAVSVPVVAIGGIAADNVSEVVAAGADAVAVIGAVVAADDIEQAARRIVEKMEVE